MSYFSRTPKISSQSITTRTKGVPKSPRHHKGRAFWLTSVPSKAVTVYPKSDPITGWTVNSLRTGLICTKIGMSTDWDEWGVMRPLTFLKVEDNHVVEIKTEEKHGYNALKIGAGFIKTKNMNRSQMGTCAVANVPPKRWFVEFRVTPDAMIPVGTRLTCMHFQPGQSVDVMGISKGKGFQGVMKRWGFSGGAASHGNSLAHRTLGSTGQRQDPGRVFPGKKMPGRMGNAKKWVRALKVFGVYPEKNAISVIGGVPGAKTKMVKVKDNWGYKWLKPPPFPTYLGPKPKDEALFGYTREKNPWWDEDKLDSLQHVQALYEGYKKFMQDHPPPPNDEFFRRLNRKDSSPNYMGLRGSGNSIDDKILESGKQILEKKQQEEQRRAQEATERAKLKALKAKEKQEKKALEGAQQ